MLNLVCSNCHTRRLDRIDTGSGMLTANGRAYSYAEGYLAVARAGKAGRQKPGMLRKTALWAILDAKKVKVVSGEG